MVEMLQIEALSQQIAEQFQPERIILFGSYAYGEPNETESDIAFPKVHNLILLLDLLLLIEPELEKLRSALATLTIFAVAVRYPRFSANQAVAEEVRDLHLNKYPIMMAE